MPVPTRAEHPIVYMPIESSSRELDSRLLVARDLVDDGALVVIGSQRNLLLNLECLVPGLVVFKGANRVQQGRMAAARKAGHRTVVVDEEVLALRDPSMMLRDIDPRAAQVCDLVLAQGAAHARVLRERRGFRPDQIVVTGNPRADLLRPPYRAMHDAEARELAERFGRFVLVNSNACAVNPIWGTPEDYYGICVQIGWLDPDDPDDNAAFRDHLMHDQVSFTVLRRLLDLLPDALPDHRIVLRPHPSERFEPWAEHYGHRPRIVVTREGGHVALMQAADLVVHTSCTTGVEAALLGRPALSLLPDRAPVGHWYLSNYVNPTVASSAEAADAIARLLNDGDDPFADGRAEREALLRDHFADFRPAAPAVSAALRALLPEPREHPHWQRKPFRLEAEPGAIDRVKVAIDEAAVRARLDILATLDGRGTTLAARQIWTNLVELRRS